MDDIKDLEYLFNRTGLYSKKYFYIFSKKQDGSFFLDKKEVKSLLTYLGIGKNKIETRCTVCKKDYPFDYAVRRITSIESGMVGRIISLGTQESQSNRWDFGIDLNEGDFGCYEEIKITKINEGIEYIHYDFRCTNHDKNHYQMIIRLEIKKEKVVVQKIGQYPSMLDIFGDDFKEYEKTLNEFGGYDEYRKSFISYGEGYYVGAFVYLRRVLEKIVDNYTKDLELTDNHFETRMNACKDRFDSEIQDTLKNLYGVLSFGVHSLSEDECKEYYQYVKAIIEIQLEHIKREKERKVKIEKNKAALSSVATVLSKKKVK